MKFSLDKFYVTLLSIISLAFFGKVLSHPDKLIFGADSESHWIIAFLIKNSWQRFRQVPLWDSHILVGRPLLGNSLSGLFYPFNLLFLVLPIDATFNLLFWFHVFLIGTFTYLFCRRGLGLGAFPSFFSALSFMLAPKVFGHVYNGHFTFVSALPWVPLSFYLLLNVLRKGSAKHIVLAGLSFTLLFFADVRVFFYTVFFSGWFLVWHLFSLPSLPSAIKNIFKYVLVLVIFLGLAAVQLLPALEFSALSTRKFLTYWEVVIPSLRLNDVLGLFELLPRMMPHPEMVIHVGILTLFLALVTVFSKSRRRVFLFFSIAVFSLLFSLGANFPFYKLFFNFVPGFKFLRVPPRLLIFFALSLAILSGFGLEVVRRVRVPRVGKQMAALFFVSFAILNFWFYNRFYVQLGDPSIADEQQEIGNFLVSKEGLFRIYSANRRLSPKLGVVNGLHYVDGEDPTQLTSFVRFMEKAGGYQFDGYSTTIPPYQVTNLDSIYYQEPNPSPELLGLLNTKYIVLPSKLEKGDLEFVRRFDDLYLYENEKVLPRASVDGQEVLISFYSPNKISLEVSLEEPQLLILSEIWYPGWRAYDNGREVPVLKAHDILRGLNLDAGYHNIEFVYRPRSFQWGLLLSVGTLFVSSLVLVGLWRKV